MQGTEAEALCYYLIFGLFTFTEELVYDFLSKYLMSDEDLVENGYPRPCQSTPGKAVFKANKESPSKDRKTKFLCSERST